MKISGKLIVEMIEHAKYESPLECCGLIAGTGDSAEKVYRLSNMLKSETRYQIDPKEHFAAAKDMRNAELEMLGVYHSHPKSSAFPSSTDVSLAFYPEIEYMIISLLDTDVPDIRSFNIADGDINEVKIEIV